MARYLSNRGIFVSRSVARSAGTSDGDIPVGLGRPESKPELPLVAFVLSELGGAGSIDVYVLEGYGDVVGTPNFTRINNKRTLVLLLLCPSLVLHGMPCLLQSGPR